jgi:hypothetical protein
MKGMLTYLLLGTLAISCAKDELDQGIQPSIISRPVNTGYLATDNTGSFIRVIGSPNVYRDVNSSSGFYEGATVVYPNPTWINDTSDQDAIWTVGFNQAFTGLSKKLWLLEADYLVSQNNVVIENGFAHQVVAGEAVWQITTTENNVRIALSHAKSNDYRLYIEVDGVTYSDNLARRPFLTY